MELEKPKEAGLRKKAWPPGVEELSAVRQVEKVVVPQGRKLQQKSAAVEAAAWLVRMEVVL